MGYENINSNIIETEKAKQEKIAQEYLRENKNHEKLMEDYQNNLRVLDSLRNEEVADQVIISKTEEELKLLSERVETSLKRKEWLFNQLSHESMEKYLKPEE